MERHIFSASILNTPPSMVLKFYAGSRTPTSCSFPSREGFGSSTVGVKGVKMVGDAVRRCWLDVADGNVALEILERVEVISSEVVT